MSARADYPIARIWSSDKLGQIIDTHHVMRVEIDRLRDERTVLTEMVDRLTTQREHDQDTIAHYEAARPNCGSCGGDGLVFDREKESPAPGSAMKPCPDCAAR